MTMMMMQTMGVIQNSKQDYAPASPSTNAVEVPPSGFQEKEEESVVMFTDNGEVDPVEEEKSRNATKNLGMILYGTT